MKKLVLFFPMLFIFAALSNGTELHVNKNADNLVKFISDAKIEKFEGVTKNVDGYMYWEGDDLTNKSNIYYEVDLNTLDTGIGLRNRHMRENYLETDKYRFTYFSGKIIEANKNENGDYDVKASGTITIHGVVQPLTVTGTFKNNGNNNYNIQTKFNIKLSDFKIDIPQLMFLKVSDTIELQMNINMMKPNNIG